MQLTLTYKPSRPGSPTAPGLRSWPGRAWASLVAFGGALALALSALAAPSPPPAPTQYVTDPSGFLTPFTQRDLGLSLRAYEQRTGRQVLVWIGSADGDPIEDFAARAFQAWKVGRAGQDDGLALFVFPTERRLRFEVGYGLEGALPDAYTARILNEIAVPRLRAGAADEAVRASLAAALGLLDGRPASEVFAGASAPATGPPAGDARARDHTSARPRTAQPPRPLSALEWVLVVLFAVFMIWLLFTHPALAFYLLQVLVSGGRGGGGGGDGGFRGGGGRSGGGGASASW